jgi:hypothetical protein
MRQIGAVGVALAAAFALTSAAAAVSIGKRAPDFSLKRLGGGRLALRELRGKVVLLDFWTAG